MIKVSLPVFLTLASSSLLQAQKSQQPNIVFVLADDMGIGDIGCYGQKIIKTPNIDALAASGVQFMNHYSGSTVSAPSRCSLLTGKHTGHAAIRGNKGEDSGGFDMALPDSEVTVAEILKSRGYATACVGKWGLGGPETSGSPMNQGFDYFYGYMGQGAAHHYYPDYLYENAEKVSIKGQYSHYLIMEKGLDFIRKNDKKPFFVYFAVTPPHADLDIPDYGEYGDKFEETPYINTKKTGYKTQLKPKAAYAAMVAEVDKNVGQIVELLRQKGELDNTIIIFSSDNGVHKVGGNDPDFFHSNAPFRGYKRDLYEGGIRAPFIVSWKDKIKPHRVSNLVSAFWDFLPTVCDITGAKVNPGVDGISILPELIHNGKGQKQHAYIYHEFYEQGGKQSIINRDGWKLIRLKLNNPGKTYEELYNIKADPKETDNKIKSQPAIANALREQMKKMHMPNSAFKFKAD